MIKLFEEWLNESSANWEAMLDIAKKRKTTSTADTSRKFGLSEDSPYQRMLGVAWQMIESGSIYGLTVPSYPFVIAISGTGDDYGNDEAWLIKSKEDFFRWIFTVSPGNKMFPDLSGVSYSDFREDISDEEVDDLIEFMKKDSEQDDYSNGYKVEFFKNEEEMKARAKETLACSYCEGSGEDEDGEECEDCGGSGQTDPDDIDSSEAYDDIIDGSLFPDREVNTNW